MGLFMTPWVPDMLDISGSFGRLNLSWNQALADIDARLWMNTYIGGMYCFAAYPGGSSGMDFLLDPRFAWSQTFGDGSNGSILNYGGGSYNNGMDWFNRINQGSSSSSNSNSSTYDPNKDKCTDLINLLQGFIAYLEKSGEPAHREWIAKAKSLKDKAITKDYTYENKYNDLLALCKDTINKDLLSDYLISDQSTLPIGGTNFRDLLLNAGHPDVVESCDNFQRWADEYRKDLDKFSDADMNLDAFDARLTTSNILGVLSKYNTNNDPSLLQALFKKYNSVKKEGGQINKDANKEVIKKMNFIVSTLKLKAESRKNYYNPATQAAINDLVRSLTTLSETNPPTSAFVNAFDKLYETLRLAEISVIEKNFNSLYKDIGLLPLFDKNDSKSVQLKVQNDLNDEHLTARISNATVIGPAATTTNTVVSTEETPPAEGVHDGDDGNVPPAAQSESEANLLADGTLFDCGTLADGKRYYQCLKTAYTLNGAPALEANKYYYYDNGSFYPITLEDIAVRTNQVVAVTGVKDNDGKQVYKAGSNAPEGLKADTYYTIEVTSEGITYKECEISEEQLLNSEEAFVEAGQVEAIENLVINGKQIYKLGTNAPEGLDSDKYYTIEDKGGKLELTPCDKSKEEIYGDYLIEIEWLAAVSGLEYDGKSVYKAGSEGLENDLQEGIYYYVNVVDGQLQSLEPCDTEKLFKDNNCIVADGDLTVDGMQVYTVNASNNLGELDASKKYYFKDGKPMEYTE